MPVLTLTFADTKPMLAPSMLKAELTPSRIVPDVIDAGVCGLTLLLLAGAIPRSGDILKALPSIAVTL